MLMIRFQRIGRKNDPAFRIAVLEKTSGPKAGKYVDLVGTHNPKTKETNLKPELIKEWMSKGAQLSASVSNLLISKGVLEGKKAQVISQKNLTKHIAKKQAEEAAAAAKLAAETKAAEEAGAKAAAEAAAAETVVAEEVAVPAEEPVVPADETPTEVIEEPTEAVTEGVSSEEAVVKAV
jgi:small subunit ribosomal protein S16